MAAANPWWKRAWLSLWGSMKAQPYVTVLFLPLLVSVIVLAFQVRIAREDAREARVQSINIDRLAKFQETGKAVDLALASYFQSVSELGLAERNLRVPGTYAITPVNQAQASVLKAREAARVALANHGSDVQGLRGAIDPAASQRYMTALAVINSTVESDADINKTGANITALGKLVMARNALVDQAMKKVG